MAVTNITRKQYCYIHKGDFKRGIDTNNIMKTDNFYVSIAKNKSGAFKIKLEQTMYLCFSTDFLIENADEWYSLTEENLY